MNEDKIGHQIIPCCFGLDSCLEKGALAAVALLGKVDRFLGNPKVRIPLPGYLNDVAGLPKNLGQASVLTS